MLRHYVTHREAGLAGFLDESTIGLVIAGHLGDKLPRFLEFMAAADAVRNTEEDSPDGVAALGRAHALLNASSVSRERTDGGRASNAHVRFAQPAALVTRYAARTSTDSERSLLNTALQQLGSHKTSGMHGGVWLSMQDSELSQQPRSDVAEALQRRLRTYAAHANTACAWPDADDVEPPYIYNPRAAAATRLDPAAYTAAATQLLARGGVVLQFVDAGEQVAIRGANEDDLVATPLAYADAWAAVHTWYPHRVPLGDRVEGVPTVARLLVASLQHLAATAGAQAIAKLKVCYHSFRPTRLAIRR